MEEPMDGARVSYVGEGDDELAIGDVGKVLDAGPTGSHVMWSTGARAGDVTLTLNGDLVVNRRTAASYSDSLDSGQIVTTAVRQVYDRQGARGLIASLDMEGHLAPMVDMATAAIQSLAVNIRRDPSMQEVLAQLEDDEGSEIVHLAAVALMREAFGSL